MGNPFTCMWDVVNFVLIEHLIFESKYRKNVLVLVRFTDDMFIIWKKIKNQPNGWKGFKRCPNQPSNLNYFFEDLGEKVVFVDLEIWIDRKEHTFMHKPHTKEISLLLHLPPHSSYPKELWKVTIHGL